MYQRDNLEATGGTLVDIETGQLLFDLSCTWRTYPVVWRGNNEAEEWEQGMEQYTDEIHAAAEILLPDDEVVDL